MKGRNGTEIFLTFKASILIYGLAPSKIKFGISIF
jgi:hypothetical protein